MKLLATLALLLAATAARPQTAQTPHFIDPANLRGERVYPRTGRELPIDESEAQGGHGLAQLLRKLNTRASIMNIVAHPDDEDGGMLTLYSRGFGARVADISLTRGEGGQNAMTGDFEDALGLLRTQELLSNDRYTGVDQFFGTEVDFGFSKTKEEAFAKWTHDRVLYDVVRAIRLYRPLVLTSTWTGNVTDGHGQHQVSGQIAQEAFLAAGDPKVFPELTAEGILPWQPLKIYARVPRQSITAKGLYDYATNQYVTAQFTNYVTGDVTTTPPSVDITVHEGTPDPILTGDSGHTRTYIQFARLGLSQQKSQMGPNGIPSPTGAFDVPYHLYASRLEAPEARPVAAPRKAADTGATIDQMARSPIYNAANDLDPTFFAGIDTSLEAIAPPSSNLRPRLQQIATLIQQAITQFNPTHPESIAPTLAEALKQTDTLIADTSASAAPISEEDRANVLHELRIKQVQLNDALVLALNLNFKAILTPTTDAPTPDTLVHPGPLNSRPPKPYITPGESADIISELTGNLTAIQQPRATIQLNGKTVLCHGCTDVIDTPPDTVQPLLNDGFTTRRDAPPTRPYFTRTSIEQPVYDLLDPTLRNAPQTPAPITVTRELTYQGVPLFLSAIAESNADPSTGSPSAQPISIVPPVSVSLSTHAQSLPSSESSFHLTLSAIPACPAITSEKLNVPATWKITPESTFSNCLGCSPYKIEVPTPDRKPTAFNASVTLHSHAYSEGYRPIGYGDLPRTNYFTPAETRIVPVDLTLPVHHRIAYLQGTGDAIPEALASINLIPTLITVSDLNPSKLAQFDTVILGVRTYSAHPDLHGAPTQALLDYARHGGNVIVQYQTSDFTSADAPYPLDLGPNEKVVDETAPVHLLDGHNVGSRLLFAPNHLTSADFNDWIEERGHGFLATWDPHYAAPTETHDPGQDLQRGGLLTTRLGQGHWTYVAFALYRQLPEAVPGAFRLFTNLLALADAH